MGGGVGIVCRSCYIVFGLPHSALQGQNMMGGGIGMQGGMRPGMPTQQGMGGFPQQQGFGNPGGF
jgi:hypothetical protein